MDIQVIKRDNSLKIERGDYTSWLKNALSDAICNTLISEGAAVLTSKPGWSWDDPNSAGGGVTSVATLPATGELGKIYQTPNGVMSYWDGDSYVTLGGVATTPYLGACIGDSISTGAVRSSPQSASTNTLSFATWATVLGKKTFEIPPENVFSVGGDSLAGMFARISSVTNLNPLPSFCIIEGGANTGPTYASMITSAAGIINALLAKGITPVFLSAMPSIGGNSPIRQSFNAWLFEIANGNATLRTKYGVSAGKVLFCDFTENFVDYTSATGDPLSTMVIDGLHWSAVGSFYAGKKIAETLEKAGLTNPNPQKSVTVISVYNATTTPNGNMIAGTGSLMMGTAGAITASANMTVTGTMPTGLWFQRDTGDGITNVTLSSVARTVGNGNALRIQIAKTNNGTIAYERFAIKPSSNINVVAGDIIVAEIEYTVNAAPNGVCALALYNGTSEMDQSSIGDVYPKVAHSGKLRTPLYTVPATGVTTMLPQFVIWLAPLSGASIDVTIDRFIMYKIT